MDTHISLLDSEPAPKSAAAATEPRDIDGSPARNGGPLVAAYVLIDDVEEFERTGRSRQVLALRWHV